MGNTLAHSGASEMHHLRIQKNGNLWRNVGKTKIWNRRVRRGKGERTGAVDLSGHKGHEGHKEKKMLCANSEKITQSMTSMEKRPEKHGVARAKYGRSPKGKG